MDITPLLPPDHKIVQSYASGRFKINGEVFSCPVILQGSEVRKWDIQDLSTLNSGDLSSLDFYLDTLSGQIDILLVGTGTNHKMLTPSQRANWKKYGLTVDWMDTPAACRTFNVLTAEGRRVAAALIPI